MFEGRERGTGWVAALQMVPACVSCGWVLVAGVVCIRNRSIVIFYIFGWIYRSWRWEVRREKRAAASCAVGPTLGLSPGSV